MDLRQQRIEVKEADQSLVSSLSISDIDQADAFASIVRAVIMSDWRMNDEMAWLRGFWHLELYKPRGGKCNIVTIRCTKFKANCLHEDLCGCLPVLLAVQQIKSAPACSDVLHSHRVPIITVSKAGAAAHLDSTAWVTRKRWKSVNSHKSNH